MNAAFLIIVAIVAVGAWCPWFTSEEAAGIVKAKIEAREQVRRICTLTAEETTISKTVFGYTEQVSYTCAFEHLEQLSGGRNTVFIPFWGIVLNMPEPLIK